MELIWLLIGLIVLVVIISLLWRAGGAAIGLAGLDPTARTVVYILMLLLLVVIILYFFGGLVPGPFGR